MIKLILATLLIGMMGSCEQPKVEEPKKREVLQLSNGYLFEVITYDSCEYLINLSRGNTVHKGNCSNPNHKENERSK